MTGLLVWHGFNFQHVLVYILKNIETSLCGVLRFERMSPCPVRASIVFAVNLLNILIMENISSKNSSYTLHNHHEVGMGGSMFCTVILSDGAIIFNAAFDCVDIHLKEDENYVCILCMTTSTYFYVKIYDKKNNTLEGVDFEFGNSEADAIDFFNSNGAIQIVKSNHKKMDITNLYPFRDLKFPYRVELPAEYLFKILSTGEILKAQLATPIHLKSFKNPFEIVSKPCYIWEHRGISHFSSETDFLAIKDFKNAEILLVNSGTSLENFYLNNGGLRRLLMGGGDYLIGSRLVSKNTSYPYEITNIDFDFFEIKIESNAGNSLPSAFSLWVSWQEDNLVIKRNNKNQMQINLPQKIKGSNPEKHLSKYNNFLVFFVKKYILKNL